MYEPRWGCRRRVETGGHDETGCCCGTGRCRWSPPAGADAVRSRSAGRPLPRSSVQVRRSRRRTNPRSRFRTPPERRHPIKQFLWIQGIHNMDKLYSNLFFMEYYRFSNILFRLTCLLKSDSISSAYKSISTPPSAIFAKLKRRKSERQSHNHKCTTNDNEWNEWYDVAR